MNLLANQPNHETAASKIVEKMRAGMFTAWMAQRSEVTAAAYTYDLRQLANFLGLLDAQAAVEALIQAGETATNALLIAWRLEREQAGLSPATIARGLVAVSSVLRLAKRIGRITWKIEVDRPRIEAVEDRRGPAAPVVSSMVDAARNCGDERTSARNGALLALLAGLGLRRAEVLGLDIAHVDLAASKVLASCKGRRNRDEITLPAGVHEALSAWIAVHPRREEQNAPLFCGLDRSAPAAGFPRLSTKSLANIIANLGEQAGATSRVRPHGLRHAFATTALDAGADVRAVASALRHRGLTYVQRYDDGAQRAADRARRLAGAALGW